MVDGLGDDVFQKDIWLKGTPPHVVLLIGIFG